MATLRGVHDLDVSCRITACPPGVHVLPGRSGDGGKRIESMPEPVDTQTTTARRGEHGNNRKRDDEQHNRHHHDEPPIVDDYGPPTPDLAETTETSR